jgi:flagellar L-ring protein precursor FlgH
VKRALLLVAIVLGAPAHATDLYAPGRWPALASDRRASEKGDILTILVYESSTATNRVGSNSKKNIRLDGRITGGSALDESGSLSIGGGSDNLGTSMRSGQIVAQISAIVEDVAPNGDLLIAGAQQLNINGEKTNIKVRGRVRPADVSAGNVVLSSRLADAAIDYDGRGFVSRSGKPGIVGRIFNWLGLL